MRNKIRNVLRSEIHLAFIHHQTNEKKELDFSIGIFTVIASDEEVRNLAENPAIKPRAWASN